MADKLLLSSQVLFRDKRLKILLSYYRGATRKIINELNFATDFGIYNRGRILRNIDLTLKGLDKKTHDWFQKEIEVYYKTHSDEAVEILKMGNFPVVTSFSKIDKEAVKTLSDGIMGYYREAYSGVKRSAMRILGEAARERIKALLAEGKISGDTRRQISDKIAGKLKRGLVALIDRGGRRWSFEAYSKMLTRTMLVRTANQGMTNRLQQNGYDLVQVSDHLDECPLCRPWEGKILSLSGNHPKYPVVDKARDGGLFHPNCRHRLLPYHEKLAEISTVWNVEKQRYIKI